MTRGTARGHSPPQPDEREGPAGSRRDDQLNRTVLASLVGGLLLSASVGAIAVAADPPTVTDFSVSGSPSKNGSLTFGLTFSAPVGGLEQVDLSLSTEGAPAADCVIGAPDPAGEAETFTIVVSGCADGTVGLVLAADSVWLAGEEATTGPPATVSSALGTMDATAPAVASLAVTTPTPVTGTTIEYSLSFSEPVTGLSTTSFTVTHSTAAGWSVAGVSGAGANYVVTLTRASPPSQAGSVTLTLKKDAVSDGAGNAGPVAAHAAAAVPVAPPSAASATITINGGAASTSDPTLKLTLTTSGFGAGLQMRFSLDGGTTWTAYEAFSAARDLALPPRHPWGTVTVTGQFRDGAATNAGASQSIQYGQAGRSTMALRPSYLIKATLDYANGRLTTQQTVDFTNDSKQVIGYLDFSVFARQYDKLAVSGVWVEGRSVAAAYTNSANMRVPLGFNLRPGEKATARINFVATANSNTSNYQRSRLAKADGLMQVSSWHPLLSDGHGVRLPGDAQFSVSADYRFELTHPSGVVIAAPGTLVSSTKTTKVYTLANAREYAFAASPQFATSSATSAHGVQVIVYYIPGTPNVTRGRDAALKSLEAHTKNLGPYPYKRLVIAQGSRTSVALEYSGMVFMGRSVIGHPLTIAHEVAHQWWYGIVGNDQLNEPWLDEGFAEFTSRYFSGASMPSHCSTRPVSSSIYDFPNKMTYDCNSYSQTVYYKGAVFLNGVRTRLGNAAFMNALRAIVQEYRFKIVTTADVRAVFVRYASNKGALNSYMDGFLKSAPTGGTDPSLNPQVTAPARTLFAPQSLGANVLVRVSWAAASGPNPVQRYELQRRKGSGAWVALTLPSLTATSVDVAVASGAKYRFRVRARDSAGNFSAWATTTAAKIGLFQETAASISWSGAWSRVALAGASGGYVRHAAAAGRVARLSFSGTSVALVSTRGPNRGIAEVWVNGEKVDTIDLYASGMQKARVVWAGSVAAGTHSLEVRLTGTKRAASTGTRVDVDAFLIHP